MVCCFIFNVIYIVLFLIQGVWITLDWTVNIFNSFSYDHSLETKCSWLVYYPGRKSEDEFLSVAIKLAYPILSQKMDLISSAAMWQESSITKKS